MPEEIRHYPRNICLSTPLDVKHSKMAISLLGTIEAPSPVFIEWRRLKRHVPNHEFSMMGMGEWSDCQRIFFEDRRVAASLNLNFVATELETSKPSRSRRGDG